LKLRFSCYTFGFVAAAAILAGCGASTSTMPSENQAGESARLIRRTLPRAPSGSSASFKVVYSFKGSPDGANPLGGLLLDQKGALYGTTMSGGAPYTCYAQGTIGCGTVFKLTPSGSGYSESVIYSFPGNNSQGASPAAGLVVDKAGVLYGTTQYGNSIGRGVLFKLTPTTSGYTESILHDFGDPPDGINPVARLVFDTRGALYGTTPLGGWQYGCYHFCAGCGAIFYERPQWQSGYNTLYSFCQNSIGPDGSYPQAGVIFDKRGALYGTTSKGGAYDGGTVFRLTHIFRLNHTFRILHNFCAQQGCADGATPEGDLIFDSTSALYGTTVFGGTRRNDGTVFKLIPTHSGYTETVLYRFRGNPDGAHPVGDLVFDKSGALYGATSAGGASSCRCGIVFKLSPSGSGYRETILHSFTGGADGAGPKAGLIIDDKGALYGVASSGGVYGNGTVFELTP
jgi:uncharacterized repeat protein (TIGR03803 family)